MKTFFISVGLFTVLFFVACTKLDFSENEVETPNQQPGPILPPGTACPPGAEIGHVSLESESREWLPYRFQKTMIFESEDGQRVELFPQKPLRTAWLYENVQISCSSPGSTSVDYVRTEEISIVWATADGEFLINDCSYIDNLAPISQPAILVDMAGGYLIWEGDHIGRKDALLNDRGAEIASLSTIYPRIETLFFGDFSAGGQVFKNTFRYKLLKTSNDYCWVSRSEGIVAIERNGKKWVRSPEFRPSF